MAKIIQFQIVEDTKYWLTEDGKLYRSQLWKGPPQVFDPKTGKWK